MQPSNLEPQIIEFDVREEDLSLKRLDKLLSQKFTISRSLIKKMYEDGLIRSEAKLELKKLPPVGTKVILEIPEPQDAEALPENIPINIVYEDSHLIIVNKVAGMVVHPAPGNYTGTLVNALLHHCQDLKSVGNIKRPGIVHRLDKGTSGIMVVAKDQKTHEGLVEIFSNHDIHREYQALVIGNRLQASGKIETMIGRNPNDRKKMKAEVKDGKIAITHFHLLAEYENYSHLSLKLETGRTHQIRVHLSHILQRPILGDRAYANVNQQIKRLEPSLGNVIRDYPHPFLHAKALGFKHPITGEDMMFSSELPDIFKLFLPEL